MGTGSSSFNQEPVVGIAFEQGQNEDTGPKIEKSKKLKPPDPPKRQTLFKKSTNQNKPSNKALRANLDFYQTKIKSDQGRGHSIDEMLEWRGNYKELERNHSYIQWLFPIPESNGMNYFAQALQEHEAEEIKNDPVLQEKVLAAFEMMLDFYGMVLTSTSPTDFTIQKCEGNWKERYENLNRSSHNFLRITRILISLGEFGLERFQKPWVTFIMFEAYVHNDLERLKGGSVTHWINAISDLDDRQETTALHEELKSDDTQTVYLPKTSEKSRMKTELSNDNDEQDTCVGNDDRVDKTKQIKNEKFNSNRSELSPEVKSEIDKNKVEYHRFDTRQEPINEHNTTKHAISTTTHVNTIDKTVGSNKVLGNETASTENCTSKQNGHSTDDDSQRELLDKSQEHFTEQYITPIQGSKLLQDEFGRAEGGEQSPQANVRQTNQEADFQYINPNRDSNLFQEEFKKKEGGHSVEVAHKYDGHNANLLFYQGKIRSNEGYSIEDMLSWWGHFDVLDGNDQYIQWLFPISTGTGANRNAQPLQRREIEEICDDPCLYEKYIYAIQMMLDFYGMELVGENREVFYIVRTSNWEMRFVHLNRSPHNYSRMTRILKSLGEMRYDQLQVPLLSFLFHEIFSKKTLTNITGETIGYWIDALSDEKDKSDMFKLYQKMSE